MKDRRVVYQQRASAELERILDYINSRSDLGVKLSLVELDKIVARIARSPDQFPLVPETEYLFQFVRRYSKQSAVCLTELSSLKQNWKLLF